MVILRRHLLFLLLVFILFTSFSLVIAHGDGISEELKKAALQDRSLALKQQALSFIVVAGLIAIVLVSIAIVYKKKSETVKWFLFLGISIPIILATLFSAGSTIYLNLMSETAGPVHWHADFELWKCEQQLDLLDPEGLINRIGSTSFHEHGDNRIHVEGVVIKREDVTLHRFFELFGGVLTSTTLLVPSNEGFVAAQNGELCNGQAGKLQVFVYKVLNPEEHGNWVYKQEKISDFTEYVLSPQPNIPPGDCIIVEFGEDKKRTDKICGSYELAISRGELSGS